MSQMSMVAGEGAHSPDRYTEDSVSHDDGAAYQKLSALFPKKTLSHTYSQERSSGRNPRSPSARSLLKGQSLRNGKSQSRRVSRVSEPGHLHRADSLTTKVLSANQNKVNELKNKIEELNMKIHDLEHENKLCKTVQFRQERTIKTLENKENDLPTILDKHINEIRALKEQNKRLREKCDKLEHSLRDAEDEVERVRKKMIRYKDMCEGQELMERGELNRKLAKVEQEMEQKDTKLQELQKHIEILKKNHRYQIGVEINKQKSLTKQMEALKEKNLLLENQLKAKRRREQRLTKRVEEELTSKSQGQLDIHLGVSFNVSADCVSTTSKECALELGNHETLESMNSGKNQQHPKEELIENMSEAEKPSHSEKVLATGGMRDDPQIDSRIKIHHPEVEAQNLTAKVEDTNSCESVLKKNLGNSKLLEEERRKKDYLLKKLMTIEEAHISSSHQTMYELLAMKSPSRGSGDCQLPSVNRCTFDSAVDVPSCYDPVQNTQQAAGDVVVRYEPSFGPSRKHRTSGDIPSSQLQDKDEPLFKKTSTETKRTNRRPSLLESLFGPQAHPSKNGEENKDAPTVVVKSHPDNNQQSAGRTTFPWDSEPASTNRNKSLAVSDISSANLDSDFIRIEQNKIDLKALSHPKRCNNSSPFIGRPTVSGFDEDIEEFVL